jgi:hypothetical protein
MNTTTSVAYTIPMELVNKILMYRPPHPFVEMIKKLLFQYKDLRTDMNLYIKLMKRGNYRFLILQLINNYH